MLLSYFLLAFVLSVPLWVIGAITRVELLPGLPLAALNALVPGIAALLITHRRFGRRAAVALLARAVDYERIDRKIWYLPILALTPAIMLVSYVVMRAMGRPLPDPQFPWLTALALFGGFLVFALGEEIGWPAYATEHLEAKHTALATSLIIGVVWAAWHVIALLQAHRSAIWIAAWCLGTVAYRVLIVWRFNNTNRSVFATILCHSVDNVSWILFPNFGSHYDPRVTGVIAATVAAIVTVVYGPDTLAGRHAS